MTLLELRSKSKLPRQRLARASGKSSQLLRGSLVLKTVQVIVVKSLSAVASVMVALKWLYKGSIARMRWKRRLEMELALLTYLKSHAATFVFPQVAGITDLTILNVKNTYGSYSSLPSVVLLSVVSVARGQLWSQNTKWKIPEVNNL